MAAPDGYLLDKASIESLRREVSSLRHQIKNLGVRWRRAHKRHPDISTTEELIEVGIAETDITGAVGRTFGKGQVKPYDLDKEYFIQTGNARILCPNQREVQTWFTNSPKQIDEGTGVAAAKWQGIWFVIEELCDPIDPYCEGV